MNKETTYTRQGIVLLVGVSIYLFFGGVIVFVDKIC